LEDLLQEIAQHILGLAHITIVAVPYIALERFIIIAVVRDKIKRANNLGDQRCRVKIEGGNRVKNFSDRQGSVRIKGIGCNSFVVIHVHSSAKSLMKFLAREINT
jgi:hypothetical protein